MLIQNENKAPLVSLYKHMEKKLGDTFCSGEMWFENSNLPQPGDNRIFIESCF